MSSAIYYSQNAFRVDKFKTYGRQVAGNEFLEAYCKSSKCSEFWVYAKTAQEANDFKNFVKGYGINKDIKFINFENTAALKEPGLLFFPGPDIAELSRSRSFFKANSWSICGVTHTTSSARVMKGIESIVTSPLTPWDALICTSKSVKSNVLKIIEVTENNLRQKIGAKFFVRPQLPIIPLGINTSKFNFSNHEKTQARIKLGIQNDEIAVLYLGRLSFHAKANPFPMYKALENTKHQTKQKIVLIECGWYENNQLKNAFAKAANYLCPNIRLLRVDGNNHEIKNNSLAAADIFCSLSDNVQETFGITPIEAMSSGLPCVVSDWNGYKDTIRSGIDGFRVPSLMPEEGIGNDLAFRYSLEIDTYDMYIGHTSNLISIDINKTTSALTRLVNSQKLRNEMGENAKQRCKVEYDWSNIINKYITLWNDLNQIRKESSNQFSYYKSADRLDPFLSFSQYSTDTLTDAKIIRLKRDGTSNNFEKKLKDLKELLMINYASYVIPDEKLLISFLKDINENATTIKEIKTLYKDLNYAYIVRAIMWLYKFDFIEINN